MSSTDQCSIGSDRITSLLASSRRQCTLSILRDKDELTVEKLARTIAARERNETFDAVDDDVRDRVVVSLVHNHLPRLADHGVLEYDRERGEVAPGETFETFAPFLEQLRDASVAEPHLCHS